MHPLLAAITQRVKTFRVWVESRLPVAPEPSLLLWLWLSPQLVMNTVLDLRPFYLAIPLALLDGVLVVLAGLPFAEGLPTDGAVSGVIVTLCALHAALFLLFVPALPYWVLNLLLKKPGRYRQLQTAVVWGMYPLALLSVFAFAVLGGTARAAIGGQWLPILGMLFLTAVFLLLWAWAVVILVKALAAAMRVSGWASLGLFVLFWVPQCLLCLLSIWPLMWLGKGLGVLLGGSL